MASRILQRMTLAAVLAGAVGLALVPAATAERLPGARPARPTAARGFNLFAGAVQITIDANRVQCGLNNLGEQCVNATNSPTLGGGYWPKGSPDQYVFNGGLQVVGVIPGNKANFAWAGDTVGAYFFDATGSQRSGTGVTNMYMSTNKDDLDAWPTAAYVNDSTLYDAALLHHKSLSQQDTWVRYWDGDPNWLGGRQHPMGLLVDQRTLAWNFPTGNQDIVYFIIRFINITASDPARYAGLSQYGYSTTDIEDIRQIALAFRAAQQAKFGVAIPDTGFTLTQVYAGPQEDPDVDATLAGSNYSTANLPFSMDFAWLAPMAASGWQFPSDIFFGNWARTPGFQGLKFLKGPADALGHQIGITMFTNTVRQGIFSDPSSVQSTWRVASNHILPVDGQCNTPVGTPLCFIGTTPADTRMMMFSGPLTIKPGESQVVVTAALFAAAYGPAIATDGHGDVLGSPAYDLRPGVPGTPTGYISASSRFGQTALDTLRVVDRATGWNSAGPTVAGLDANANGRLEQTEIPVIKGSLLDKALVAQAVFDGKFLLPYAPDAPAFYVIPGDNQVTVVWQPSLTETVGSGDPYFAVASNTLNPLYDQNYRANDVEGYRIYRGRTQSSLTLIAQYDYAGTYITDYTGGFTNADYGSQCAPELGVTASCPAFPNQVPLVGDVVQVRTGDRTVLGNGDVLITKADTAVTGGASGNHPLQDTGVPFAYVDNAVRDGFRYFYAVTAFDINSVKSGPTSLESPRSTKTVTPRALSANAHSAVIITGMFGGDGTKLDPSTPWPRLDTATGTFEGPMPPANTGSFRFLASVPEALAPGDYKATMDSISPALASGYGVREPTVYVTFSTPTVTLHRAFALTGPSYAIPATDTVGYGQSFPFVPYDSARARRLGLNFTQTVLMPVQFSGLLWPFDQTSLGVGLANRWSGSWNPGEAALGNQSRFIMHSYWYDEAAATQPPDPTINPFGSAAHTNGQLTGVTSIFSPNAYRQPTSGGAAAHAVNLNLRAYFSQYIQYPADIVVTWGAGGAVTVRDSTHRTNLPFKKQTEVGYGFLNASAITGAGYVLGDGLLADGNVGTTFDPAVISYYSLYAIEPTCTDWWANPICADLEQTAKIEPIDITGDGISDGNGIALIINAEPFYFLMNTLPAAGTKWHLKSVAGGLMAATCTPALPASGNLLVANVPTDCRSYQWTPLAFRPAYAPGLSFGIRVLSGYSVDTLSGDLSRVHTVPDPYYVTNALELTATTKVLRFVNLPDRAIIRVYSVSGVLVNIITHNDPNGGGEEVWNLRNRNNQFVASGVYFYHVEGPDGKTKIGRFTVVNYAQ